MITCDPRSSIAAAIATLLILTGCGSARDSERTSPPSLPVEQIVSRIDVQVVPVPELNSPADDFGVSMPLDTTMLLLTSARSGASGRHSIFVARRDAIGRWAAMDAAVEVNNEKSNGMPSIAPGAESMYFVGCDYGLGDCDLYRVETGPRGALPAETIPWTVPNNVGLPVNSAYWDSQVCLSADGGALYFASDRPGGFGGKDIWSCFRNRDGSWSAPVNAGEPVNTAFDEVTPWLSPDGRTLFFSSNGHPGVGGFDVFAVEEIAGIRVRTNLGVPVNSRNDDISFSISADGSHTFLASNRTPGAGYDVFRVMPTPVPVDPMMFVQGTVRDRQGRALSGTITITDLTNNRTIGIFNTDPMTGHYRVVLPRGFDYALTAQALGYLFQSEEIRVPGDLETNASHTIDFAVPAIDGTVRLLVFFPSAGAGLERESVSDLDRAVLFLRANPEVRIEVAGHTDNTGSDEANLLLSQQRAEAVKSYMVGNRVPAPRIDVKGYGSKQPIADNATEEGRAQNRRVEMRILQTRE